MSTKASGLPVAATLLGTDRILILKDPATNPTLKTATVTTLLNTSVTDALKAILGTRAILKLSQAGTAAPTVSERLNQFGDDTLTVTRRAAGQYVIASAALFTAGKTDISVDKDLNISAITIESTSSILIETAGDDCLDGHSFTIVVWP